MPADHIVTTSVPQGARTLHGRWLTAKILQGRGNNAVREELAIDDLPCPADEELERLRRRYTPPEGFSFDRPDNHSTRMFLRLLRLDGLAEAAPETRRAVHILRDAPTRELVEVGLLLRLSAARIAAACGRLRGMVLEPAAIRSFADIFFRMEMFTRSQLRAAVAARVRFGLLQIAPELARSELQTLVAGDVRVRAATLPAVAASWTSSLEALGYPRRDACF